MAAHYERHPGTAPSLAELALAAAELDGNPLATKPGLIREAAEAIVQRHPTSEADDVLIWAEAPSADRRSGRARQQHESDEDPSRRVENRAI